MSPNLKTASIHISLSEMLDLALGTPEVGAVNLNILHNFLHVLLHLNNLKSTKVEYRGEDASRIKAMVSSSLKQGYSLQLHEYSITNNCGIKSHHNSKNDNKDTNIDVVIDESKMEIKTTENIKQKTCGENYVETEPVILIEPLIDRIAPTTSSFKKLHESQYTALEEFANNSGTLEHTKDQSTGPVTDMWYAININGMLDASQKSIDKNDRPGRLAGGGDVLEQVAHINKRLSELEDNVSTMSKNIEQAQDRNPEIEKENQSLNDINTAIVYNDDEKRSSQLAQSVSEKQSDIDEKCSRASSPDEQKTDISDTDVLGEVNCCKMRYNMMTMATTLEQLKEEICGLKEKFYEMTKLNDIKGEFEKAKSKPIKKCIISTDDKPEEKYVLIKQKQYDIKPARCADLICNLETSFINTTKCIEERFKGFEDYVNCSLRNINDTISKNKSEEELIKYVKSVRMDLEDVRRDVCKLKNSECALLKHDEIFEEQIDVLKIVKADKEEVEEALATKADLCALNKKVSHEQFDAVCDDLTNRLNEAIAKLSQQESIWQQSLLELCYEIEGKLEELGIPALKDFINNELQALKNKIQLLSEIKREQEAAGARKLLRELRCISCDKDAFMQANAKSLATPDAFPCRPNIKPYLTFKMDQVRKQQKILSQGKNLVHLENVLNENADKRKPKCPQTCDNASSDRVCNRYCGGSHTLISPQQRVARTRNCVTQWGVHDLQLVEGFVEGTDGKMYRGRWFLGKGKETEGNQSNMLESHQKHLEKTN